VRLTHDGAIEDPCHDQGLEGLGEEVAYFVVLGQHSMTSYEDPKPSTDFMNFIG